MKKIFTPVILLTLAFFTECKKPETKDTASCDIEFTLGYSKNELQFNHTYPYGSGMNIQFSLLKFYAGNFYFERADGTRENFTDKYLILEEGRYSGQIGELKAGSYVKAGIGYGVNENRNTQNGADAQVATDYPQDDALNPAADMYWGWAQGYIFMKLEGRIDVDGNGSFGDSNDILFSYHPGNDELYRAFEYTLDFSPEAGKSYTIAANLDVNTLIHNCDFIAVQFAHPANTSGNQFIAAKNLVDEWGNAVTLSVK